jgi:pimeloyl-ACP methyl ester carboxylesterase
MDAGFAPRLSRLLAMNTGLAVGTSPGPGFEAWREYVAAHPDFPVGELLKRSVPSLTDAEAAAYDAPFPDATYKAGVRAFPQLVMTEPDMPGVEVSRAAERFWAGWDGPSFLVAGAQDPVLGVPATGRLHRIVRGSPPPLVLPDVGHFAQESGDVIARAALTAFGLPPQR